MSLFDFPCGLLNEEKTVDRPAILTVTVNFEFVCFVVTRLSNYRRCAIFNFRGVIFILFADFEKVCLKHERL